jgi:hypothetical protein
VGIRWTLQAETERDWEREINLLQNFLLEAQSNVGFVRSFNVIRYFLFDKKSLGICLNVTLSLFHLFRLWHGRSAQTSLNSSLLWYSFYSTFYFNFILVLRLLEVLMSFTSVKETKGVLCVDFGRIFILLNIKRLLLGKEGMSLVQTACSFALSRARPKVWKLEASNHLSTYHFNLETGRK